MGIKATKKKMDREKRSDAAFSEISVNTEKDSYFMAPDGQVFKKVTETEGYREYQDTKEQLTFEREFRVRPIRLPSRAELFERQTKTYFALINMEAAIGKLSVALQNTQQAVATIMKGLGIGGQVVKKSDGGVVLVD